MAQEPSTGGLQLDGNPAENVLNMRERKPLYVVSPKLMHGDLIPLCTVNPTAAVLDSNILAPKSPTATPEELLAVEHLKQLVGLPNNMNTLANQAFTSMLQQAQPASTSTSLPTLPSSLIQSPYLNLSSPLLQATSSFLQMSTNPLPNLTPFIPFLTPNQSLSPPILSPQLFPPLNPQNIFPVFPPTQPVPTYLAHSSNTRIPPDPVQPQNPKKRRMKTERVIVPLQPLALMRPGSPFCEEETMMAKKQKKEEDEKKKKEEETVKCKVTAEEFVRAAIQGYELGNIELPKGSDPGEWLTMFWK